MGVSVRSSCKGEDERGTRLAAAGACRAAARPRSNRWWLEAAENRSGSHYRGGRRVPIGFSMRLSDVRALEMVGDRVATELGAV
jgi:hypothetical protein